MLHRRLRYPDANACFYSTPRLATEMLLDYWKLPKGASIWEPACGAGAISKVLEENGYKVTSSDVIDRGYGQSERDFLVAKQQPTDYIITNPPFHLVDLFIKRAMEMKLRGFAFLLLSSYWCTAGHAETFIDYRPSHVLPLAWCTKFEGLKGTAEIDVSWVIWEGKTDKTIFDVLRRPQETRIRKCRHPISENFQKVTLNIEKGDKEILARLFDEGWSVGARQVLRNFCEEHTNVAS